MPARYALADPVPARARVVPGVGRRGRDDQVVPPEQSAALRPPRDQAAGGTAEQVTVPGDHHTGIIDPAAASFRTIESLIGRASGAA